MDARRRGARQAGTRPRRTMSVAVRETADGAHRPSPGTNPVRHASVDTATPRSTATQADTPWDRENGPASHENSQPAGRFRRWWQVLGSNQRRLSRRFYSPSLLPKANAADQRGRRSRWRAGLPPSAMRPYAPGLGHGRGWKKPRTGPMGALRRPSTRLLASDLAFQDACSLPSSPSSAGSDSGRVSWTPRASVIRLFAASACPSMQCA
jgi:hypothetical protein